MDNEQPKEENKDMVQKAIEAAARLEEANKKQEELLTKNEALMSRMILGGRTEAAPQVPKKEISPQEYAQAALRGKILT